MKKFKVYWMDGKEEIISGYDINDAVNYSKYGTRVTGMMRYYHEIKNEE